MSLATQREVHLQLLRQRGLVHDLLEALETLAEHAGETYPHFESPRGQADIDQACAAIKAAKGDK